MYTIIIALAALAVGALTVYVVMQRHVAAAKAEAAALKARSDALEQAHADEVRMRDETIGAIVTANTERILNERREALSDSNRRSINEILAPLNEKIEAFDKAVREARTNDEMSALKIQKTFETTLQLFARQQQSTVEALREQTQRIGTDADNLARALKGDNKMQGDWGEMLLESLLEQSGLERDRQYFTQWNVRSTDDARNLRPDVVVSLPEQRKVVIDSKVSLTAYADSVNSNDDDARAEALRRHVASVRRHIDELSAKDYPKAVDGAIGYVLMFMPNEGSYAAAIRSDATIGMYAYSKQVIIISPSTLMMTLQLAYNMWQSDNRNRNFDKIVQSATDLYDKVAGFADTFADIRTQIQRLTATYDTAHSQLYTGRGNVMSRIERLRKLGLNPRKRIAGAGNQDTPDDDIDNEQATEQP